MKIKLVSLLFFVLFAIVIYAESSFSATLIIKETDKTGRIIYQKEEKIEDFYSFTDKKYKDDLSEVLKIIKSLENKYVDEKLYFVKSYDGNFAKWTISSNILTKDTSVSHFISEGDEITVSGWVNRNNKDIFGFRIFNF